MARGRTSVALAAAAALALTLVCVSSLAARGLGFATPTAASKRSSRSRSAGLLRGSGAVDGAEGPSAAPAAAAAAPRGEPWELPPLAAGLAAVAAVIMGVVAGASPSQAFFGLGKSGEIIGEFAASGMIFKDTLDVERITDPKVKGVTIYQTDFSKSGLDKVMAGNLLQSDSGASGLACIADGPVLISKDMNKNKDGEEIFSEDKGLGKALKVRRVYDERSKNLIYVVFTERFQKSEDPNGSRFKSQACAVHVTGEQ